MEEEKKSKTPTQLASKEREDLEDSNKECCKSNNRVNVESRHQEECRSPSYVRHHRHIYK
jgi:hypothetical protein